MEYIEIPVIRVHQSIGDFYVGVMAAQDLYYIATVDRIRLENLSIPKYAGFQRALLEDRVRNIKLYIQTPDSTFPNAIILSIDSKFIQDWEIQQHNYGTSILKIKRENGVATIIDGQHRAAALDEAPIDFSVIVSIFIDLEMSESARIFAKINSTQKAVNPSIAYQLFGYAEGRSPQKTAHIIADTLNTSQGSPFYKQLRMLGTQDDWSKGGVLSQSTFCKELMKLYSKNPIRDEYLLLRKERLDYYEDYPLRDIFIEKKDQKILEIVWKFFFHVAEVWKDQWGADKSILVKTTGYSALMYVLKTWLLSEQNKQILNDSGVLETLKKVKTEYENPNKKFTRENYPSGSQGEKKLRDSLLKDLGLVFD